MPHKPSSKANQEKWVNHRKQLPKNSEHDQEPEHQEPSNVSIRKHSDNEIKWLLISKTTIQINHEVKWLGVFPLLGKEIENIGSEEKTDWWQKIFIISFDWLSYLDAEHIGACCWGKQR